MRLRNYLQTAALVAASIASAAAASAAGPDTEGGWTRFRGPNGTGIVESFGGAIPWTEADVAHRIDLPGPGNGSPAILGDRAYLQTVQQAQNVRSLVAIDFAVGKILWKKDQTFKPYPIHKFSSYASSTPCVDEQRVYNVWGTPDAVEMTAYTHDGERVWSRDLGGYVSEHGFGTSPMRVGDLVVLYIS